MLDAFGGFSLVGATIFFLKDNNFTDIKKIVFLHRGDSQRTIS